MTAAKKFSPYTSLVDDAKEWARKVLYPHRAAMWTYPKGRLGEGWTLSDLYERTAAAQQLGYDVLVEAKEGELRIVYRKQPPSPPWKIAP